MGAKLFVPFTLEQLDDLYAVGLELEGHHILALSSDKRAIEEALTPVRRTAQPRVSAKHGAARGLHPTPGTSSSSGSPDTTIGDTSIDNESQRLMKLWSLQSKKQRTCHGSLVTAKSP